MLQSSILGLLLTLLGGTLLADAPATIAGRSIEQEVTDLSDSDRVVRLRAIRSLGAFGGAAGPSLTAALDHEDAAVRYLAAQHLGRLGKKPLADAIERLEELADDESSLAVRMAASYSLCRAGRVDKHLPLLIQSLDYPERGMACTAAALIGSIGPDAKAAIGPLEVVWKNNRPGVKGGDYHLGGASMNALRKVSDEYQ